MLRDLAQRRSGAAIAAVLFGAAMAAAVPLRQELQFPSRLRRLRKGGAPPHHPYPPTRYAPWVFAPAPCPQR